MFGLSGTAPFGLSGTGSSDYREPKSCANRRNCWACAPLNYPNKESYRFLLTSPRLCTADWLAPPRSSAVRCDGDPPLTHVTLVWQEGLREDWLRFGKPVGQRIIDRSATKLVLYHRQPLPPLGRCS